ncbi:MAG: type III-B CRISPR module-associated Cmr3 family protein, partial [Thermodesulfobacteriota bacterium]
QRQDSRFSSSRWGLLGLFEKAIDGRSVCFGGERRLSWLEPVATRVLELPAEDRKGIEADIRNTNRLALTFVTPAAFTNGWKPAWADGNQDVPGIVGLRLRLVAAALGRWVGHSGWDLALKRPKPSRALVPAGSTYWFDVLDLPADAIGRLWLASVCDHEQDRKDGFGLVIPGV